MPTRRHNTGVAALGNKIYVTGGLNCKLGLNTVECYDPDTNTWSQVVNMNITRAGHGLISQHGRLYAIGGWKRSDDDGVEVYDPDNNTWTLLQHNMDGKVLLSGASLIKKYYLNSSSSQN